MSTIDALLAEREGYLRRGLKDRVAQVDAAIESLGGVKVDDALAAEIETTEAEPDAELETADAAPAKGRRRS